MCEVHPSDIASDMCAPMFWIVGRVRGARIETQGHVEHVRGNRPYIVVFNGRFASFDMLDAAREYIDAYNV